MPHQCAAGAAALHHRGVGACLRAPGHALSPRPPKHDLPRRLKRLGRFLDTPRVPTTEPDVL